MKKLISAIMCGIYISVGATAYVVLGHNAAGALFFAAGILLVSGYYNMLVTRIFALYAFKEDGYKPMDILIALIGNGIGCIVYSAILSLTRFGSDDKIESLKRIVALRLDDSYLGIFLLAILCGFLVAAACLTSKVFTSKGVALSLTVIFIATFVLCVPEHIVADIFFFAYYSFTVEFNVEMLPILAIVTCGNLVGGIGTSYLEYYRTSKTYPQ